MQVFTPANETIMVLRDETPGEKKTDGGLFIPGRAVELSNQGEVRAVNPTSQYAVGDRIVFTKYAGSEIELNGVTYLLLKEKEIQGTIKEIASSTDVKPENPAELAAAIAAFEQTERR